MPRQGLVKCLSLIIFVFLMCPRGIRPTAPKQRDYVHALKPSSNDVSAVNVLFKRRGNPIVKKKKHGRLEDVDNGAGYDLNDDEIRKFKLWPKGIVPYYIDVLSFNDKVLRDRMRSHLNFVNGLTTSIRFLEMPTPPKDDKTRWVFFVNRRGQLGCYDHSILNFTNEGVQHVNLGYDCILTEGELLEAVLAIAGVPPQHNSPDRDEYIKVIEENIMPEKRYLFHKLTNDQWLFHDVKYDFASVGHFHHHKHSATGRATIEFLDPHSTSSMMGENDGLSTSDIRKLGLLYNNIASKKENKVPECDKLFRKGHNFYQHTVSFSEPNPIKKPNKYLGLPEEHHEDKDYGDKNHEKDTKEGGDSKAEEYTGSEDGDDEANQNHGEETSATRKMDLKSRPLKLKQKSYKIDLLSYLSDYQTGDEHRRKAIYNKTLKGNK